MRIERDDKTIVITLTTRNKFDVARLWGVNVYPDAATVNVPATGEITAASARELARALLLAADLAEGVIELP